MIGNNLNFDVMRERSNEKLVFDLLEVRWGSMSFLMWIIFLKADWDVLSAGVKNKVKIFTKET